MIEGKRILITGGAGFIGTHLAERLVARNEVTALDIDLENALPYSHVANHPKLRKVRADVRDPVAVADEVRKADIVLHLAAILGVRKVIAHPRDTIDTIFLGTRNVLEAARNHPKLERLLNFSTSEVYGNVVDAREGAVAQVHTSNDPRISYASAKLAAEHLVWAYHREFGLRTVTIRPFNIFGPKRKTDNAIGRFAVRATAGGDVVLLGDGSQLRSWCYIDDFVDATLAAVEREAAVGQDFNLGNPTTAGSIRDLAERVIRLAGSRSKITTVDHTFSDIGVRAPNSTKARELLDFDPKFDLDAGLVPTIEWYREHAQEFKEWM